MYSLPYVVHEGLAAFQRRFGGFRARFGGLGFRV